MPRKHKRKGPQDKLVGIILVIVGLALMGALGGAVWWLRKNEIPLDAENCPVKGPRAIHLVMIDRSDPISGQQAQRIRQYMQKARDDASFGTRFDLYTFEGDTKNELVPVLRLCAPGRPEQANELIENPELIRKDYNNKFAKVLDRTIEGLLAASTRSNSPIVESLRAASISSFGNAPAVPMRVTLVSDMIQHTDSLSHFRSVPDFATLSKSITWATIRPSLRGADVEILYLLRPTATRGQAPIQNRGHQHFWEQLISASNGQLQSIEPI